MFDALLDVVIQEFVQYAKEMAASWIMLHVPEYTGALVLSHLQYMDSFDDRFEFGSALDYAQFVAAMGGVNWTKPSSKDYYDQAFWDWFHYNADSWFNSAWHRVKSK